MWRGEEGSTELAYINMIRARRSSGRSPYFERLVWVDVVEGG
jgi:hypothetical protein